MVTKYETVISDSTIAAELNRITNQIYKLLPSREEELDWQSPLQNLIVEIAGMDSLFNNEIKLLQLLSKLEGLLSLTNKDDFLLFRKNIFECLSLISEVKQCLD